MSILAGKSKKSFKVILDSNNTSSFTGNQFNASFWVDFTKIIQDDSDFDKPYEMSFCFRTISTSAATSTLTMGNTYILCIDMGKGFNAYSFDTIGGLTLNPVGILSLSNDFTNYTATQCNIFFDTKNTDNAPTYIPNIRNLTTIKLSVVDSYHGYLFNSTNNAGVNSASKYVCILTFQQV